MKKTQEILGLPIISISDGTEVGKVKSIIVNAVKGAIDYVVVDSGIQILSARVIPTDNVLGIGEYALTIENEGVISDISKMPSAVDLLRKDVQVKGAKVLTKKGRLIGEIGDIYVDEDNCCQIKGLEFIADITQKRIRLIPRESVITFGKNLIVVKEDVESSLVDKPTELYSGEGAQESEKKNLSNLYEEESFSNNKELEQADAFFAAEGASLYKELDNSVDSEEQTSAENTEGDQADNAASLFEQKQKQYLIGRKTTKPIADSAGNVIVAEGEIINDEIIDECKNKGKLIELVMNNRA